MAHEHVWKHVTKRPRVSENTNPHIGTRRCVYPINPINDNQSQVENLRDVFSKFDYDHDGTVSGKEILDVFRTMGAIFTRQVRINKESRLIER